MSDFAFVTARLATGAKVNSDADVQALVDAGITAVIDCRIEFDDTPLLATHPQLLYLWNGTADDGEPKPPQWFEKSLTFALPLLARPQHKVYAHCSAGVNRGPSTAYAILRAFGLSSPIAFNLVKTARPQARIAYSGDADAAIASLDYD